MRIGIDARFLGYNNSGLARYSENLLEALSHADERNEYLVFVHAKLGRRLRLGPNFRVLPVRGMPLGLRSMRRLTRMLRREALDLLHVLFPLAPLWIDLPFLLTVHDVLPFKRESGFLAWRFPLARLLYSFGLYPMSLRRAKWVLCVSRTTRDAVSALFPDLYHKSIIMHAGVDEIFRTPIEPATMDLIRHRLNLPGRYVLYSGSTRADKNIPAVLRTFALLRQRNPKMEDLHLVLETSGDAATLDGVKKLIRQFELEDHVRILHDMKDEERRMIFTDARALLILGRAEGFGFPIIEAQITGVPVIAADAGALPEVAGENGAFLVDPDNQDDCVSVLERVLTSDNLRAYLIENGRINAGQFTWSRAVGDLLQIYELLFYPRDQVDLPQRRRLASRILEWLPF